MSFYTDNRPRLIEHNLYQKIIRKQISNTVIEEKKPFFNYEKIGNMMGGYLKRNWSFILIILIFVFMLIYRYNIIKKDLEIKKAKKKYLDQIILENYKKEKEKQELEEFNNNQIYMQQQHQPPPQQKEEIENEEIIKETFEENLTFDDLFASKLDKKYEPFYGNSSFAPF